MSRAAILVGAAPLVAALLALIAVYGTGFDQNVSLPVELESRFYGFFLDQYPLFAFVIVYGLARTLAAAFAPGPTPVSRRVLGGFLGVVSILALSLHPTFGGFVLRGGFMTGGVSFLNHLPWLAAYLVGTAVAASIFGAAMGLGGLIAGRIWRTQAGWWRALLDGALGVGSRFLLLWYAFAVLGFAGAAGFGVWPHRPLGLGDTVFIGVALVIALLPHVLLVMARTRAGPDIA